MQSGFGYFPTHDATAPDVVARMVEERGHSMLVFAEHTHIPVHPDGSPRTPEPARLARRYWHTYDVMVACTAAVMATKRIHVGPGICLVPQHEPLALAKVVASIDHLSGGRFVFGVGAGWNLPEVADHGIDPADRFKVLRERIMAMKAIWTQDIAEFHGAHVDFGPMTSWPKPVRRPHPRVIVGGVGPRVFDRVLDYGDGWLPNWAPGLLDRVADLRARAADAGREVEVHILSVPPDPSVIEACERAGVDTVMRWLPSAGTDRIQRAMDAFETAIAEMRGE